MEIYAVESFFKEAFVNDQLAITLSTRWTRNFFFLRILISAILVILCLHIKTHRYKQMFIQLYPNLKKLVIVNAYTDRY